MRWLRRLMHRLVRTWSGRRRPADQSAIGTREQDALSRWESEGGPPGEVRQEDLDPVTKTGAEDRAKQESMTNINDNAAREAATSQSTRDDAAAAAGNPAEQGGQG